MTSEDSARRSAVMRAVKSRDTRPEMIVRRAAHALGYRFRLHAATLPGSPDLVFPSRKKAIFVHGCFWHGHACARGARRPRTNAAYWSAKIGRNVERDARAERALAALGWEVLTIWECGLRDRDALARTLEDFLGARLQPSAERRPGRARL